MSGGRWPGIGVPWAGGGGGGIGTPTFVAGDVGYNSTSGGTILVDEIVRTAGDILVAHVGWEDVSTTVSIPNFTVLSAVNDGGNYSAMGYWLNATSGSGDIVATFGTNVPYRHIEVLQFRPTNVGVAALDAQTSGSGTGTAMSSGAITTSGGANGIVVGAAKNYATAAFASHQIGGVAATATNNGTLSGMWYRIITANLSAASATATGASNKWIAHALAIK